MTLLFAGHDTTTSTVAFLFYELPAPAERDRLLAERDAVVATATRRSPSSWAATCRGWTCPRRDAAPLPAAWIGPRRSCAPFEFAGQRVPAGVPVNYSPGPATACRTCGTTRTRFARSASPPGGPRADPQGRLRAVRRRLAHVHRHALRPARDQGDRQPDPARLHARPRARVTRCASARCRRSARATGCPCACARARARAETNVTLTRAVSRRSVRSWASPTMSAGSSSSCSAPGRRRPGWTRRRSTRTSAPADQAPMPSRWATRRPRCASGRRAWRGSVTRARWRSSRP